MRFPRNVKIFRGQLDAAPWVCLFFLLMIFFMLQSSLFFTPGIPINLPTGRAAADTSHPFIVVFMDINGHYYFDQQRVDEDELLARITKRMQDSPVPIALKIMADRGATIQQLARIYDLARSAGIETTHLPQGPSIPLRSPSPEEKLP